MGKRYGFLLKVTLLLIDLFVLNFCFILTNVSMPVTAAHWILPDILIGNGLWIGAARLCKLYKSGAHTNMQVVTSRTVKAILINISGQMLLYLFIKHVELPAQLLLTILCTFSLVILISRFFLTRVFEFLIRKARLQKKTAIVGLNETGIQLAQMFQQKKSTYLFEGFFDNAENDYTKLSVDTEGQIVSSIDKCIEYAVKNDIREIYSTILPHQYEGMQKLMDVADQHCVRVRFVHSNKFINSKLFPVEYFDQLPVINLRCEPLQNLSNRLLKRFLDVIVSSFAVVFILSWLVPVIGLLIKYQSKGTVFFKQQRSGKDNAPFWCYKFRSMTANTESDTVQATKNDSRITPIGAFLRKTSLDEFPQFWNVLKGDMSIIGPRPHMLAHTEIYSAIINKYMIRQFLKPGITGWAQANGYRGETQNVELMQKRIEHDIWYMENWSIKLDFKIFIRTFLSIFIQKEHVF